jgi:hypothetical protein
VKKSLLPALGALIVLVTFVTKDGLRDHYKDLAASVDSARLVYEQGNQIGDVAARVEGVRRVVERQNTPGMEGYSTFYQVWIGYAGQLDRLKELLDKLHGTSLNERELESLKTDNDQFHQSIDEYGHLATANPNASQEALSKQSGEIWKRIRDLEKALLDSATSKVARSERDSTLFGYCSYLFYLVGWTLSFVAKVWGIPGIEAVE